VTLERAVSVLDKVLEHHAVFLPATVPLVELPQPQQRFIELLDALSHVYHPEGGGVRRFLDAEIGARQCSTEGLSVEQKEKLFSVLELPRFGGQI
jgi:hypothetical protein